MAIRRYLLVVLIFTSLLIDGEPLSVCLWAVCVPCLRKGLISPLPMVKPYPPILYFLLELG
jgi:hypothetical protein